MNYPPKPVLVIAWEDYRGNGWGDVLGDFDTLEEAAKAALAHLEDPGTTGNNCADVIDLRSGQAVTFQRDYHQIFRGEGSDLDKARDNMWSKIRKVQKRILQRGRR